MHTLVCGMSCLPLVVGAVTFREPTWTLYDERDLHLVVRQCCSTASSSLRRRDSVTVTHVYVSLWLLLVVGPARRKNDFIALRSQLQ